MAAAFAGGSHLCGSGTGNETNPAKAYTVVIVRCPRYNFAVFMHMWLDTYMTLDVWAFMCGYGVGIAR